VCLAVPAKIVSVSGDKAEVEIGGIRREASLALVSDQVSVGDYVLIHTGYAIAKVNEKEARTILRTWKEVMAAESGAESL